MISEIVLVIGFSTALGALCGSAWILARTPRSERLDENAGK